MQGLCIVVKLFLIESGPLWAIFVWDRIGLVVHDFQVILVAQQHVDRTPDQNHVPGIASGNHGLVTIRCDPRYKGDFPSRPPSMLADVMTKSGGEEPRDVIEQHR